jgi:pyruvate,orthophosphate dikinase
VLAAAAVVTERGGRASHAAVVARGLDRPAVCGTGPTGIADGDIVSVDGDRGLVLRGEQPLHPAHADPQIKTFLEWHDAHGS